MRKAIVLAFLSVYSLIILVALIGIGFRFSGHTILYNKGLFIGSNEYEWSPEWDPSSTPLIIVDDLYYHLIDIGLGDEICIIFDGLEVKFSGEIIEELPAISGKNFTQINIKLNYIDVADNFSIFEFIILPFFVIVPFLVVSILFKVNRSMNMD